ncbi:sporulation protein Spo3 [Schizosaccharomyces japonicus yFS275]|uniref:Sporulation protein Spo3 n=1 Tax=Schizosaccharomyces japonicus (strain yFS275 / FY16936) TaxID=402676 RepID=B6K846_SCHJY|nr:sporulation protein Spo3 [Schizosaccharomyces japonicus yFS275]EEB09700.1 sporulation protein Spo3 [Schizosaccharomyces japonicus yFS275]
MFRIIKALWSFILSIFRAVFGHNKSKQRDVQLEEGIVYQQPRTHVSASSTTSNYSSPLSEELKALPYSTLRLQKVPNYGIPAVHQCQQHYASAAASVHYSLTSNERSSTSALHPYEIKKPPSAVKRDIVVHRSSSSLPYGEPAPVSLSTSKVRMDHHVMSINNVRVELRNTKESLSSESSSSQLRSPLEVEGAHNLSSVLAVDSQMSNSTHSQTKNLQCNEQKVCDMNFISSKASYEKENLTKEDSSYTRDTINVRSNRMNEDAKLYMSDTVESNDLNDRFISMDVQNKGHFKDNMGIESLSSNSVHLTLADSVAQSPENPSPATPTAPEVVQPILVHPYSASVDSLDLVPVSYQVPFPYSKCLDIAPVQTPVEKVDAAFSTWERKRYASRPIYHPYADHCDERTRHFEEFSHLTDLLMRIDEFPAELTRDVFTKALEFFNANSILRIYRDWLKMHRERMLAKGSSHLKLLHAYRKQHPLPKPTDSTSRRSVSGIYKHSPIKTRKVVSFSAEQFDCKPTPLFPSNDDEEIYDSETLDKETDDLYIPRRRLDVFDETLAFLALAAEFQKVSGEAVSLADKPGLDELKEFWYDELPFVTESRPGSSQSYRKIQKLKKARKDEKETLRGECKRIIEEDRKLMELKSVFNLRELFTIAELLSLNTPTENARAYYYNNYLTLCRRKQADTEFDVNRHFKITFAKLYNNGSIYDVPCREERLLHKEKYYSSFACSNLFVQRSIVQTKNWKQALTIGVDRLRRGLSIDIEGTCDRILEIFQLEKPRKPTQEEKQQFEEFMTGLNTLEALEGEDSAFLFQYYGTHSRARQHAREFKKWELYYAAEELQSSYMIRFAIMLGTRLPIVNYWTRYWSNLLISFFELQSSILLAAGMPSKSLLFCRDVAVRAIPGTGVYGLQADQTCPTFTEWFLKSASDVADDLTRVQANFAKSADIDLEKYEPLPEYAFPLLLELRLIRSLRHMSYDSLSFLSDDEVLIYEQFPRKLQILFPAQKLLDSDVLECVKETLQQRKELPWDKPIIYTSFYRALDKIYNNTLKLLKESEGKF